MDERTKEQLSEFLANELHTMHLNGAWFDESDVMDIMDDFFKKKKLFDKRDQLEEELKRVTRQIESGEIDDSDDSDKEEKMCKYCSGEPMHGRKPLMTNHDESYTVFINSCNYLEDSVVGNSVPHSLLGVKINFCPVCGKELKDN